MVDHFPDGEARVGFGVPVGGQFIRLEQPHLAGLRAENARLDQPLDAGVFGRGRQTSTMLEARALVPAPVMRRSSSVRIGQVPLMAKPAWITAPRKVSQPVEVVPLSPFFSDCLKA